jgi:hypothetical protein
MHQPLRCKAGFHYSGSRKEHEDAAGKREAHSDRTYEKINSYGKDVDYPGNKEEGKVFAMAPGSIWKLNAVPGVECRFQHLRKLSVQLKVLNSY